LPIVFFGYESTLILSISKDRFKCHKLYDALYTFPHFHFHSRRNPFSIQKSFFLPLHRRLRFARGSEVTPDPLYKHFTDFVANQCAQLKNQPPPPLSRQKGRDDSPHDTDDGSRGGDSGGGNGGGGGSGGGCSGGGVISGNSGRIAAPTSPAAAAASSEVVSVVYLRRSGKRRKLVDEARVLAVLHRELSRHFSPSSFNDRNGEESSSSSSRKRTETKKPRKTRPQASRGNTNNNSSGGDHSHKSFGDERPGYLFHTIDLDAAVAAVAASDEPPSSSSSSSYPYSSSSYQTTPPNPAAAAAAAAAAATPPPGVTRLCSMVQKISEAKIVVGLHGAGEIDVGAFFALFRCMPTCFVCLFLLSSRARRIYTD
jgi:hypothetical protein